MKLRKPKPRLFFFSWSYIITTSQTSPYWEKKLLNSVSVMLDGNPPRKTCRIETQIRGSFLNQKWCLEWTVTLHLICNHLDMFEFEAQRHSAIKLLCRQNLYVLRFRLTFGNEIVLLGFCMLRGLQALGSMVLPSKLKNWNPTYYWTNGIMKFILKTFFTCEGSLLIRRLHWLGCWMWQIRNPSTAQSRHSS